MEMIAGRTPSILLILLKRVKEKGRPRNVCPIPWTSTRPTKCGDTKASSCLIKLQNICGVKLTGKFNQCEGCGLVMAEQKAVRKQTSYGAIKPYVSIFEDASGPHPEILGGNKSCFQAVDDFLQFGWCVFAKTKMVKFGKQMFKEAKLAGHQVERLYAG
jgi:hypothetical protein